LRHSVLALLAFAVLAAPAQAATPPAVHSGPATGVGPLGATLNGDVNANGHATTIHFEYGTTKKYGKRTPAQAVGSGTTPVPVAAAVGGLRSSTRYHFRLVAVSSAGTRRSGDRTFKTLAPTTAPAFTPNPVVYSKPYTIFGQLQGTGAAHAVVTLMARGFPFTTPFSQFGNSVVSNADGTYTFPITAALGTAQFQIHADTKPPIDTSILTVPVSSLISMHVRSHARRGSRLRFAGTVLPAQNGLLVRIQKRTRSGFHNVAHTTLKRRNAKSSKYSVTLRVRRTGSYRALVVSAGGLVYPGVSPAKRVRVTRH
jgi:hypothetical protein